MNEIVIIKYYTNRILKFNTTSIWIIYKKHAKNFWEFYIT